MKSIYPVYDIQCSNIAGHGGYQEYFLDHRLNYAASIEYLAFMGCFEFHVDLLRFISGFLCAVL